MYPAGPNVPMSFLSPSPLPEAEYKNVQDSPLVLIVEDDPGMSKLVAGVLAGNGWRIVEARTAAEAQRQIAEELPQTILLDLHLPDGAGESLAQRILERAPNIPVIIMTGYGAVNNAVRLLKLGVRDYILKEASFIETVPDIVRRTWREVANEEHLAETKEQLQEQVKRQAAVARFGIRVLSITQLQQLFDEATRMIADVVDVEFTQVQELSDDGKHLLLRAGVGWTNEDAQTPSFSASARTPMGLAVRSGKPVIVDNLPEDPRFTTPDLLKRHNIISGVTVLIHGPAGIFGGLAINSSRRRQFKQIDVDFLQAIANVLAAALGRLEVEESLKKERTLRSAIADTTGSLMVMFDREGRILSFNRACEQLTGYTFAEVAGRSLFDFLVPESEKEAVRHIARRLQRGERHNRFQNHWVTKSGEQRLISWCNNITTTHDGQIDGIMATGIDITEQRRLERELLEVAEQERERLGRDLHDDLCQYLTGIGMMIQRMEGSLGGLGGLGLEYKKEAESIGRHLKEALARTRLLAHGLSPLHSQGDGLAGPLTELALYVKKVFGVVCRCTLQEETDPADPNTAIHLFRITQEAVQNAIRHGNAEEIEISVHRAQEGSLVLKVADNGIGFPKQTSGTGIRNMEQRATLIGGQLTISSTPDAGTTVTCSVPKETRA